MQTEKVLREMKTLKNLISSAIEFILRSLLKLLSRIIKIRLEQIMSPDWQTISRHPHPCRFASFDCYEQYR